MKTLILFSLVILAACKKDKEQQPATYNPPKVFCWTCTEKLGGASAEYEKCAMTETEIQTYITSGAHILSGAVVTCVKKQ